ncbi:MAG: HAMP domain-containing sensor histidine kinase [Pseudomonadota bacterium]
MTRPRKDALLAVALGVVAFAISSSYGLEARWHDFATRVGHEAHLEELPIAFLVAGLGFGWFAWRRWRDFEKAALHRRTTNRALAEQLDRNQEIIAELSTARQKAMELDRAKTRFLAHMSHELRTPLNAIMGFSELMKHQVYGPLGDRQYEEYVATIHESGQHLLELINDLLDLTRIESGDMTPHIEVSTMRDLAESACKMLRDQAAAEGVHLSHVCLDAADVSVNVDRRMIRQVLINLIANAIRHTPRTGHVTVTAVKTPQGEIGFSIADTGEGMDPQTVKRLDRGFAEVENAFRREHHGAGLGLPLSRSIAHAHGGSMTISSALGEGTTIDVLLPGDVIVQAEPVSAPTHEAVELKRAV